jgi:hypothetical protein
MMDLPCEATVEQACVIYVTLQINAHTALKIKSNILIDFDFLV